MAGHETEKPVKHLEGYLSFRKHAKKKVTLSVYQSNLHLYLPAGEHPHIRGKLLDPRSHLLSNSVSPLTSSVIQPHPAALCDVFKKTKLVTYVPLLGILSYLLVRAIKI